ncbi:MULTISPECIES: hypothetical protein [Rhodococcus]|uniref:hypothetical protein n=1 Tax=Rhodococcus TaxID=1827 RepID=UPI000B08FEF1|nr:MULTISPECIES: hypothetical protein [Rhodococcus]MCC4306813.1 hypothetical protein [Rhodococcus sp. 3-2]BBE49115.1 hypothetical protein RE2895_60460 [Rhodococcus erythropolis]
MARKVVLALVLALLVMFGGASVASAQDTPPPQPGDSQTEEDESSGLCNVVGGIAEGAGNTIVPGGLFGDIIGGLAGASCDAGGNPVTAVTTFAGDKVNEMWDSQFGDIVKSFLEAMAQVLTMAMTWWIKLPNPDLANSTPLQAITEYTGWIQLALLTASVIFMAIKLAAAKRHALLNEAEETYKALARTVFATTMFASIIALATLAGDRFAEWIVDDTSNKDPIGMVNSMLAVSAFTGASPGLLFVIGLVGILGALAQAALLVVRQGLLIVAVAAVPVAAAASGTSTGSQSYQKLVSWILAFLLFKPIGALVYAMAFLSAQDSARITEGETPSADQFQQSLIGIILLALAAAVLPALQRLIAPAVAAVGSGGSGAAATGMALMAGAAAFTGGKSMAAGKSAGAGSKSAGAFSGGPGGGNSGGSFAGGGRPGGGGGGGGGGGSRGGGRGGAFGQPPNTRTSPASGRTSQGASGSRSASSGSKSSGGGSKASKAIGAVGSGAKSSDRGAGDLAGDRYSSSQTDLGRNTIRR